MIIDCHGHYTTAPAAHTRFREAQLAACEAARRRRPTRRSATTRSARAIENNQLRLMRERGVDLTLFSPRASAMAHHVPRPASRRAWARAVQRPRRTGWPSSTRSTSPAVCQLPQSPGGDLDDVDRRAAPLRRGARLRRLQPQPRPVRRPLDVAAADRPRTGTRSTRRWSSWTSRRWCTCPRRATRSSTRPARTTSTPTPRPSCSSSQGDLFARLPDAAAVIPHGGGAVPYHWGRYRGLADMLEQPPVERRSCCATSSSTPASTTSRDRPAARGDPGGQHPVRVGDDRRGPRHRPGDRRPLGRHQALRRRGRPGRAQPGQGLRGQRPARLPAAGRAAHRGRQLGRRRVSSRRPGAA